MALTPENIRFLEDVLVKIIEESGPIAGVALQTEFLNRVVSGPTVNPTAPESQSVIAQKMLVNDIGMFDGVEALERLVQAGRIMEIEYVLTRMNYRTKSLFFAVGTEISWRWKDFEKLVIAGHDHAATS